MLRYPRLDQVGHKAIIFDVDGVLINPVVDGENIYHRAYDDAVTSWGRAPIEPHQAHLTTEEKLKISDITRPNEIREIKTAVRSEFNKSISKIGLLPNYNRVFSALFPKRKLGVYTTASLASLFTIFQYAGIDQHRFDAIVTRDQVGRVKPDPEGYLLCAAIMRVDPENCLVFEDSDIGFNAASLAGMQVVKTTFEEMQERFNNIIKGLKL